MNPIHDILSSIDPAKARVLTTTPPAQRLGTGSPKPAPGAQRPPPRPAQPANGTSEASALKRKASSSNDVGQNKMQRKDTPALALASTNGVRPGPAPAGTRSTSTTPTTSMPYRGTAGLGASKAANALVKKSSTAGTGSSAPVKAANPTMKPTNSRSTVTTSGTSGVSAAPPKKSGGYLDMFKKAAEKSEKKAAAPLPMSQPAKILSKKEREAARLAAKASKGKKPLAGNAARPADSKGSASGGASEKRKPVDLGYQGTARPAKKPAEIGYKGTARPASTSTPAARPGAAAPAKKKPKPPQDRYSGYLEWSDLDNDEVEEEDEDDYASDGSSDMEGGLWEIEDEDAQALKVAKVEDAEALAEENKKKREKEERKKKKLTAMAAAARGGKKRF